MEKKEKYRANWILRITGCLLCLTLVSSQLLSGIFARYTAENGVDEGGRVAIFNIKNPGKDEKGISVNLVPTTEDNINTKEDLNTIVITNESEVAVNYTVEVHNKFNNLDLTFYNEDDTELDKTEDGTGWILANNVKEPKSGKKEYGLKVRWNKTEGGEEYLEQMGMVDLITVSVDAQQID